MPNEAREEKKKIKFCHWRNLLIFNEKNPPILVKIKGLHLKRKKNFFFSPSVIHHL